MYQNRAVRYDRTPQHYLEPLAACRDAFDNMDHTVVARAQYGQLYAFAAGFQFAPDAIYAAIGKTRPENAERWERYAALALFAWATATTASAIAGPKVGTLARRAFG